MKAKDGRPTPTVVLDLFPRRCAASLDPRGLMILLLSVYVWSSEVKSECTPSLFEGDTNLVICKAPDKQ